MAEHGFCPACVADRLLALLNNTRVCDVGFAACGQEDGCKLGQGAGANLLVVRTLGRV